MGRREGETEMGKSEAEKTMEMRDGDWDRGRGLTGSRVETRHLPASAYGGALAITPPSGSQYPHQPHRSMCLTQTTTQQLILQTQHLRKRLWCLDDLKKESDTIELERSQGSCV